VNAPLTAADTISPDRRRALGVAVLFPATLAAIFIACVAARPVPAAPTPSPWADEAERLGVSAREIGMGQIAFRNTCAVCHGPEANGIPRLGKPLRNSEFVQSQTDEELLNVIVAGRAPSDPANTTGALMPARGNAPLTEERLATVVTYLRAIQEPGAPTVSLDQWIVDTTTDGQETAGLVGASSGVGHQVFINACSACHGPNAEGIEGLGKPLATSPFVASKTDEELIRFVKTGRPIWDAENTTGLDMPPKGGNPALSDEELMKIVNYLRALHEQNGAE
jgi:disulfide bond formation protein DsbB